MIQGKLIAPGLLLLVLAACASDGSFDKDRAAMVGATLAAGALVASSLDESDVKHMSVQAAAEMDSKNKVADANNPYALRLTKLVRGMENYNGLRLNFKVYLSPEINAFAMADGTVRVYSGLLDAMPDDQVYAVIGHEVGHVALKHSYKQMREELRTSAAFKAVAAAGGTIGALTSSQLGAIAYQAVNARFSQEDELAADKYAVKMLHTQGKDPSAMKRAIETLEKKHGSGGGGFLSSHPSTSQRKSELQKAINNL